MRGGHSYVTQFRNQEDTVGHGRTRRARRLSTGGPLPQPIQDRPKVQADPRLMGIESLNAGKAPRVPTRILDALSAMRMANTVSTPLDQRLESSSRVLTRCLTSPPGAT